MSAALSARTVRQVDGLEPVRALQRVLYRSAKQDPERRFHALLDKVARSDVMWRAWCDVAANRGAPGVDGVSIADVAAGGVESVRSFLNGLADRVRAGTYRPQPLRRVISPSPAVLVRPGRWGFPQWATGSSWRQPRSSLSRSSRPTSFRSASGSARKRSAQQALEVVRVTANQGRVWVLDADIKACFDTIDHDALIAQVQRRVVDRRMIKLLRGWLRAGVFEGGIVSRTETGSPQGSPISPLLANIALHVLDEAWRLDGQRLGQLVRYCDDFVVLCPTRDRAERARDLAADALGPLGLRLHSDKTQIVCVRNGEQGFDFLGFHHRLVESRKRPGRYWMNKWPSPRAMASIRGKVRDLTTPRQIGLPLDMVVEQLNPVLRGWGAYFRQGNSSAKFGAIDSYVHERMAILASRKHRRSGFNRTDRYTWDWLGNLGIHRLEGTVRYPAANA